jgi:hypothetical protein
MPADRTARRVVGEGRHGGDGGEWGMGLVRRGRRRECERSEIRIKGQVGWRRGRSVDVHRKCEGMQRRRNDIENRVSGYRLSHGHLEGLDGGEWRDGWDGRESTHVELGRHACG